eukprot:3075421-Amphidinium_carterae.1
MVFSRLVLAAAVIAGVRADDVGLEFTAYKKQHGKVYLDEREDSFIQACWWERLQDVCVSVQVRERLHRWPLWRLFRAKA